MTLSKPNTALTEAGSLTKASIASSHPGMAHFAKNGPAGAICFNCSHHYDTERRGDGEWQGRCAEYDRMSAGRKGAKPAKYPSETSACKYFSRGS